MYPYNDAYDPIENVPIVSSATTYDHHNGGTYILVFHESLYYGIKMQHSLINPNQVRFHRLDLFDNPVCTEKLYIEVDDETAIPLQSKGTKCVFKSRVPTCCDLESCSDYDMKIDAECYPQSVYLQSLRNISEVKI